MSVNPYTTNIFGYPPYGIVQVEDIKELSLEKLTLSQTPVNNNDVTNKGYVDSQVTNSQVTVGTNLVKNGNVVSTIVDPTFQKVSVTSTTPVDGDDLASKLYVDTTIASGIAQNALTAGSNIKIIEGVISTFNSPSFDAVTVTNSTPATSNTLASKQYVDSVVAGITAGTAPSLAAGNAIDITSNTIHALYDDTTIGRNVSNQLFIKNASVTSAKLANLTGDLTFTGATSRIKLNGTRNIWIASAEGDEAGDFHIWDATNSRRIMGYYAGLNMLNLGSTAGTIATRITGSANATSKTTGGLIVNGGAGISGDLWATNITASGGTITGTLATPAQTGITSVGTLGSLTVSGAVSTGSLEVNGLAVIDDPASSTNHLTGALTVVGGVGIGENLNVAGNVYGNSFNGNLTGNVTGNITGQVLTPAQNSITSLGTLTGLTSSGTVSITNSTYATNYNGGALSVTGDITTRGYTYAQGFAVNDGTTNLYALRHISGNYATGITIDCMTPSAVGSRLNIGSSSAVGNYQSELHMYANAINSVGGQEKLVIIANNTNATINWSTSTTAKPLLVYGSTRFEIDGTVSVLNTNGGTSATTGALKVAGSIGVAKTSHFGADITMTGTTSRIKMNGTKEFWIANVAGDGAGDFHIWANSDNRRVLGYFSTGNTLQLAGSTGTVVTVPANIASTSTTTGSLVIGGGVGIGGNLSGTTASFTGPVTGVTPTDGAHLATKGYVDSILNASNPAGQIVNTNTTDASAPNTGAIQTAGGIFLAKNLYGQSNITLNKPVSGTSQLEIKVSGTNDSPTNACALYLNCRGFDGGSPYGSYLVNHRVGAVGSQNTRLSLFHNNDTSNTSELMMYFETSLVYTKRNILPADGGTQTLGNIGTRFGGVYSNVLYAKGTSPQVQVTPSTDNGEASVTFYRNANNSVSGTGDTWSLGTTLAGSGSGGIGLTCNGTGSVMSIPTSGVAQFYKGIKVGTGTTTTQEYHMLYNAGTSAGNSKAVTITYGFSLPGTNDYRIFVSAENTTNGGGVLCCSVTGKNSSGCTVQIHRVDGGSGGFGGGLNTGWNGDCWLSILIIQP